MIWNTWGDKEGMPWACRYLSLHKWRRLKHSPVYQCNRCKTFIIRGTRKTTHLAKALRMEMDMHHQTIIKFRNGEKA